MSSGRDRERDRRAQAASARTNEYFVPKDGIDREVITADICRYLGNDALVRPGNYENPQTRQVQAGYFITAYRNLTTAMIADLKADSERWEAERRATASRGQPSNVEYRASTTHQSRQYYGPTEAAPAAMQQYAGAAAAGAQQGVYDNGGAQYQQQSSYAQPATGYAQPQGYAVQDNYYVAGADMAIDQPRSGARIPVTQAGTVPRSNVQYSATPTYQQDSRSNNYYPQPGPVVSSTQYPTQPTDPYYGRAVPVTGTYDPQDPYVDNRQYQDPGSYSQAPLSSASSATATSGSQTSGTRDRERERSDRERHHGRSRR